MASSPSTAAPLSEAYLQEYSGHKLVAVCVTLMVLEICTVGLRLVSRQLSKTATGLDDWLIVPSFIFCFGLAVISICMVKYAGAGRHIAFWAQTEPSKIVLWAKTITIVEFFYTAAFTFPRLSILAMYMRIFTAKVYRITVYILALIMIALYITTIFLSFLKCRPFTYSWDKTIRGGHCIDINRAYQWITFPNILIDAVILILPLPVIWRLHVSKNQKFGLTLTFLTGSIGLIASIVRFAIYSHSNSLTDGTWASADLMILTSLEPGVYLMAACFPTYRALVPRVVQFVSSSSVLSRTLKPSTGDVDLPVYGSRSNGTIGGRRSGVQFLDAKDKSFVDDGDKKGLVVSYHGDVGSTELGPDDGYTAEGLQIHVTSDVIVERVSSVVVNSPARDH
ncbi:hypothetical protein MMC07_009102 [Pseudocyphellaria aurata]|nr:hypothetical protein [Pseudocyphellaria aurata]